MWRYINSIYFLYIYSKKNIWVYAERDIPVVSLYMKIYTDDKCVYTWEYSDKSIMKIRYNIN